MRKLGQLLLLVVSSVHVHLRGSGNVVLATKPKGKEYDN
jgi:hypothetical protein